MGIRIQWNVLVNEFLSQNILNLALCHQNVVSCIYALLSSNPPVY